MRRYRDVKRSNEVKRRREIAHLHMGWTKGLLGKNNTLLEGPDQLVFLSTIKYF